MTKRAVLYARVSGDDTRKEGRNLGSQLDMCRRFALERGYRIVEELAEDERGARGTSLELPQLTRIRDMAQQQTFDVLIVREIDRLSRSLAKQLIIEEELKRTGVVIEYVLGEYPDTPEGGLNKHIKAAIAEYERLKIMERLTRGRTLKIKSGSLVPNGQRPYGYQVVQRDGKYLLEIYEPEARIIRLIYQWYTIGEGEEGPLPIFEIVRRLTQMGVPTWADSDTGIGSLKKTRAPGHWSRSSVHKLLTTETYAGVWRFGRKKRLDAEDTSITVPCPAIVSRELWEAVQEQRVRNRKDSLRNTKYDYLVGRRLTCGLCGYKMGSHSYFSGPRLHQYYFCPASVSNMDYIRSCTAPMYRSEEVDAVVWQWVKSILADPEKLRIGLEQHRADQEKEHAPIRQRLTVIDELLAEYRRQYNRLLDLYLTGAVAKDDLLDRRTRLEGTIAGLSQEQDALGTTLDEFGISAEQLDSIEAFAQEIAHGLADAEDDFAARRRIIDLLDVRGSLTLENGERVLYTQCILGEKSASIVPMPPLRRLSRPESFTIESTSGCRGEPNRQLGVRVAARLVLPAAMRNRS